MATGDATTRFRCRAARPEGQADGCLGSSLRLATCCRWLHAGLGVIPDPGADIPGAASQLL